ncbi:Tom37 C-terminal domain-containing protein [Talaromyces proteolyticus]|uniref:Tom37 C-terminal domain-containing protein n=1 Tax=Talaromyces proteolyticus TaxID=1131652 RepID=A0AAD4KKT7_9EURO|nr:Tom37 C-terminal domain-containing protein [Talaromyces proteolyticus]KAH8693763.1 Tom37 C-terminal domain-containing protein [Talaromyces proteolyticus]
MLELHVWGPAFSLPSIDAQCLATIAYLVKTVPKTEWVLVATSDPSVSPNNELPALKDGATWVSKFRNIVDYLRKISDGAWALNSQWTALQEADNIAFSALTESNGQLLIDLSLFVSSQNYYACTSPAYGAILTWPNQWILPPKLRTAAKHRTAHLGLSSLDLEATEETQARARSAAVAAGQIPKNLISRPRETVSTLLGKTAQSSRFRLDALTAELFEPLEQLLGKKQFLLSDDYPSTLDVLVTGYLSLSLVPKVPSAWLSDSLRAKAPRLATYVQRMRDECFGVVNPVDAFSDASNTSGILPWRQPERVNVAKIGSTLLNTLADATPVVRDFRSNDRLRQDIKSNDDENTTEYEKELASNYAVAQRREIYITVASVTAGLTAMIGYLIYHGLIAIPKHTEGEDHENGDGEFHSLQPTTAQDILSHLAL